MQNSISQYLEGIPNTQMQNAVRPVLNAIGDRVSTQSLTSAGLVIKTGGSALAKTGASAYYGVVKGKLVTVGAGVDMPALSGTITAGKYNVFCFFIDSASTVTSVKGIEGAAIGKVVFPSIPEGKAMIGFLLITYASTFTGGTTALDTATTVYVNTVGAFDPSINL